MSARKGDWLQTVSGVQFWPLDPRTEKRDLMGPEPHGWSGTKAEPLASVINPWSPVFARQCFMERFASLSGGAA